MSDVKCMPVHTWTFLDPAPSGWTPDPAAPCDCGAVVWRSQDYHRVVRPLGVAVEEQVKAKEGH